MSDEDTLHRPAGGRLVPAVVLMIGLAVVFLSGVAVGVYRWPPSATPQAANVVVAAPPAKDRHPPLYRSQGASYTLTASRLSYFALDSAGQLELRESLPYRAEREYRIERTIEPNKTAIVVMDPWIDMASEHLNRYYAKIAESRLLPLVRLALTRGHPIVVLTNDPDTVKYNTRIHPEMQSLVDSGKAALLYHQDLDDREFAAYLRSQDIGSLIYIGFASNMCVIGRKMGMIPMVHQGFQIFFIPEASAAVEYAESWQDGSIHAATTKLISQWIAEIIDYDLFMAASPGD